MKSTTGTGTRMKISFLTMHVQSKAVVVFCFIAVLVSITRAVEVSLAHSVY